MSRVLVTPALPYANGDAHLGHLVEHLQVNTYVRALRMAGDDVLCVCGIDSHGAGIEIAAKKAGLAPEVYTEQVRRRQEASFAKFLIEFDGGYGTTHTSANERHAGRIWQALKDAGHITTKEVEQLQDPVDGRFLADRFVKGTCPKCGAVDQYGDACEVCGSTYRATDLKDPISVVSGQRPTLGRSVHYMVTLGAYADRLKAYLGNPDVLHPSLKNFLDTWFSDGLKDWDVSRDGPYFGFKIPGEDNKYFYVWLDAPIGYVSLTELATDTGPMGHTILGGGLKSLSSSTSAYDAKKRTWEDYWKDPTTRIEHFIGKDILYFHTLFWPAMCMASGQTLPAHIRVHGMLTLNGQKMSKSRGTFINADDFAAACAPEALRYYFAAKMTAEPQDIDLSFEDLTNRVNADLVNNVVNLVSRSVPLLHRSFAGKVTMLPQSQSALVHEVQERALQVEKLYRALDTAAVVRTVTELGSRANKLMQDTAPWALVKTNPDEAHGILTTALWVGKTCLALLKPIIPEVAAKLEKMLGVEPFTFATAADPLRLDVTLQPYEHLFARVEKAALEALIKPVDVAGPAPGRAETKGEPKPVDAAQRAEKKAKAAPAEPPAEIAFDDFAKVDLRAAKVLSATAVVGSDKLIEVRADLGPLGERTIFTGLRPHVQPEQLQGRTVVVVKNLAPRKMAKFGESHGMVLAVGEPPVPLFVDAAKPGDRVG
jgi:methionyl-tRNA synthetase